MNIKEAIRFWSDADDEAGYESRSYGACIAELDGVVAIADEDGENGSKLKMYRAADFIKWMQEAKSGLDAGDFDSAFEAVNETSIPSTITEGH